MANINLHQSFATEEKKSFLDVGILVSLLLLGVVLLTWGGLYVFKQSLAKQEKELDASIDSVKKAYDQQAMDRVYDTYKRLLVMKKYEAGKSVPLEVFDALEKETLPGVSVTSIQYDKSEKKVYITFSAQNIYDASQQFYQYKTSGIFSSSSLTDTSIEEIEGGKAFVFEGSFVLKDVVKEEKEPQKHTK